MSVRHECGCNKSRPWSWETIGAQREERGDSDAFIAADMALHGAIARLSGNPIYSAVSEALLGWLRQYHVEMLIWSGRENDTLTEHDEIIDALAAGDADAAEQAMVRHLERSRALYTHRAGSDEREQP